MLSIYPSIELDTTLKIRIGHLEGHRELLPYSTVVESPMKALSFMGSRAPPSLIVEAQVYGGASPLSVAVRTAYKPPAPIHRVAPLKTHQWNEWLELPVLISQLPLDACVLLTVWGPSGHSDPDIYCGAVLPLFTQNRSLQQGRQKLDVELDTAPQQMLRKCRKESKATTDGGELERLEFLMKRHQMGEIPTIDWLDNLVFRKIEAVTAAENTGTQHHLFVELPMWDHDVVWMVRHYPDYSRAPTTFSNNQQLSTSVTLLKPEEANMGAEDEEVNLMAVYDPDFGSETPIEAKYRRLVRLANNDRDMRPTAKVRDELERITRFSPVHELSSDNKILLWKYRYYLTKRRSALTKFVKSVSWDDDIESHEALEVLNQWVDIDAADALELLGPEVKNAQVRAYAVDRLRAATDHELELYLLQLVEALKFEPWTDSPVKSYLARFLESRVVLNPALSNNFYWYVSVQATDRQYGTLVYQPVLRHYLSSLPQNSTQMHQIQKRIAAAVQPGTPIPTPITLKQIKAQVKFMNKLLDLTSLVKQSREPRPKRIQQMRAWLEDPRNEMVKFKPTILPLDPCVTVVGCVPEQCLVFKSSMSPVKIVLKTQDPEGTYTILFKSGDDLRQDQLVMQIIQLMDELLRKENLDLKLMPYRILATSMTDGAMQFIPNEPISHVISQHHGILPFLRIHAADPNAPLGVKPHVMDNFVRSSAGYAVITYILGVGDRHLENLLIDFEGHFFHIDFGYILGKDPKPFPPMIKLPIQLIDGMGGINSENYRQFRSYCFTAFTTLRKSANLILALFNLMTESTIPNIALERDQAVSKVEERFCLDLSDEEAILHFQNLINDSVNAFLPMVIDRLHSMAQYWRA